MNEISAIRRKGITPYILPPKIYKGTRKIYDMSTDFDYTKEYFTIESLKNGNTITFEKSENAPNNTFYTSKDKSTWTSYGGTTSWVLNKGEKLYFKAIANYWAKTDLSSTPTYANAHWRFRATNEYIVSGNIMSLIYGDDFIGRVDLPQNTHTSTIHESCFGQLFSKDTHDYESFLISANNLKLPATTLDIDCYQYMFNNCSKLRFAPELPATTLADACYDHVFSSCRSLVVAPELPATTLAKACYQSMFSSCTSLTVAPELPAKRLEEACYWQMFSYCTSLTVAPVLPATTLKKGCYYGMFSDCKSMIVAPDLPAATILEESYRQMFWGCTSLQYIKCLATSREANAIRNWVYNVPSGGDFYKASGSSWDTATSSNEYAGIPAGWTTHTVSS